MEPVKSVQMNIYQSHRKDLNWPHFTDEQVFKRVERERERERERESETEWERERERPQEKIIVMSI